MRSIRQRLTRELSLALTTVAIAVVATMYGVFWEMLMQSFDGKLLAQAQSVQSLTEFEDGKVQFDFSDDFLTSYGGARPRNYFQLRDDHGGDLTRSPSLLESNLTWLPGKNPLKPYYANVTLPNGRPGRIVCFVFVPTISGAAKPVAISPVNLVVAADREELNESLIGMLSVGLGGLVLLVGAVLFLVPRVLKRGLLPVDQLADRTSTISADSLGVRFETQGVPAEIVPVSLRLNDLLARLEASFERERRFSADLAHELRTPLAELRSMAECALKWPDQRDAAFEQETLLIARHMETLVTHLLALTRGEQGSVTLSIAPVDVAKLVRLSWQKFGEASGSKGIRCTLSTPKLPLVEGDADLLRAILINLFDNAVSYTPPDGEIRVAVQQREGRMAVVVTNGPVDLNDRDLERIFDRFWRKESARSDKSHFGLGLSLCRSFAKTIQWTLSAKLDGKSLTITLESKV